jgi:triacylglycerol lipase
MEAAFRLWFGLIFVSILSGCATKGKYEVDLIGAEKLGFSEARIVHLGRLVVIDYYLFDTKKGENPPFPNSTTFHNDKDLLKIYTPIMNLQGRDRIDSPDREFYGHIWSIESEPGTLVISIRGTSDAQEWIDDVKFEMVKYSETRDLGHVERGFQEIFSTFTVSKPPSSSKGYDAKVSYNPMNEYLSNIKGINTIIVVGHSLGASLANLVAFDAVESNFAENIQLLTFASPLTGDAKFVEIFQSKITDSIRIVNQPDIVPRVPPKLFGYRHIWHQLEIDSYPNAGIKHSVACYHSLLTYLHMLDSAIPVAPNCAAKF